VLDVTAIMFLILDVTLKRSLKSGEDVVNFHVLISGILHLGQL